MKWHEAANREKLRYPSYLRNTINPNPWNMSIPSRKSTGRDGLRLF